MQVASFSLKPITYHVKLAAMTWIPCKIGYCVARNLKYMFSNYVTKNAILSSNIGTSVWMLHWHERYIKNDLFMNNNYLGRLLTRKIIYAKTGLLRLYYEFQLLKIWFKSCLSLSTLVGHRRFTLVGWDTFRKDGLHDNKIKYD